jgi:hypothetical protein
MKVKLQHMAHTRSGDKGDTSNIAVFAYTPEAVPAAEGTADGRPLQGLLPRRDQGPGDSATRPTTSQALNFVCQGALGGGVSRSLCLDNYGKALSAAVLGFELEVPDALRGQLAGQHLLPH